MYVYIYIYVYHELRPDLRHDLACAKRMLVSALALPIYMSICRYVDISIYRYITISLSLSLYIYIYICTHISSLHPDRRHDLARTIWVALLV